MFTPASDRLLKSHATRNQEVVLLLWSRGSEKISASMLADGTKNHYADECSSCVVFGEKLKKEMETGRS